MKSLANALLKLLGIIVLAVVVLVVVAIVAHGVSKTARQARKNAAIKVLQVYASPPNPSLAVRLFFIKNTSGKTIRAAKFRVVVFNDLKEKLDNTLVSFHKSIAAGSSVYCTVYTIFNPETGLPTHAGCRVNTTNRRLLALAKEVGCPPRNLRLTGKDTYKVKVLAVAY